MYARDVASRASSPPGGFAAARVRWAVLGAAVLVGVGVGAGLVIADSHGKAKPLPLLGGPAATWAAGARPAPTFSLTDENGRAVSLAAYRGRPVILTFLDPLCRNVLPRRGEALERPRAQPPEQLPAGDRRRQREHLRQRQALSRRGREQVGRHPRLALGIGTPATLAAVWRHYDIGVTVASKKLAGVMVRNVIHTEAAYVIDAKGDERALFLWPFSAADVGAALRSLS